MKLSAIAIKIIKTGSVGKCLLIPSVQVIIMTLYWVYWGIFGWHWIHINCIPKIVWGVGSGVGGWLSAIAIEIIKTGYVGK